LLTRLGAPGGTPENMGLPPDGGPPSAAATGSFRLDCARSDGIHLNLNARFVILVQWPFVLC
jgi:hypothetical protein